jgi:hypothetical protein
MPIKLPSSGGLKPGGKIATKDRLLSEMMSYCHGDAQWAQFVKFVQNYYFLAIALADWIHVSY